MRALLITEDVKAEIAAALERAPRITLEQLQRGGRFEPAGTKPLTKLSLEDRERLDLNWQRPDSALVIIPNGFHCAISFEEQPPPIGMCRHLSVSVEGEPGMMPHPLALEWIGKEFGAWPPLSIWQEEFEPGRWAVNIIAADLAGATRQ